MTNFEVRASPGVANAEATTENAGRDRLILYNPEWMAGLRSSIATNWSDWVVLAHEVGHHVAFNMDPTFPNHEAELQADYFAGTFTRSSRTMPPPSTLPLTVPSPSMRRIPSGQGEGASPK